MFKKMVANLYRKTFVAYITNDSTLLETLLDMVTKTVPRNMRQRYADEVWLLHLQGC